MFERGMFEILAADQVRDGIGNFADIKTQNDLDAHLKGVELLILDNLSSLTSVIRDNDAESWNPIQSWLLRLRRRGISVLVVHPRCKRIPWRFIFVMLGELHGETNGY
jgi:hypothetical protein